MAKANVAVAIIAKNSAKTIGACLNSIVPYVKEVVVCVDQNTTDDTAKVAKRHGARVFTGLQVSEPHECDFHGKVMAQHFAKAREASFQKLRKDVDWMGWLDSDDILIGGNQLEAYLATLPPEVDWVWQPYDYAQAGVGGPSSTKFDRERLIRTRRPIIEEVEEDGKTIRKLVGYEPMPFAWQWVHRVHEVIVPIGTTAEQLVTARTDAIYVKHQGEGHDTAASAKRNILLCEMDIEENPEDMRAWFYLGNQWFALQEWDKAVDAYERSTEANNPYQLWQTLIYLSMAYEKLGDFERARTSAFRAMDIQPLHPEPYYRLASVYMLMGDLGKCEYWTRHGDKCPDPPQFVFRNPLDRTFNSKLVMANAYAAAGETSKARKQLELAAQVIPNQQVLEGIAFQKKLEEDSQDADAFLRSYEIFRRQTMMTCSGNFGGNSSAEFRASIPDSLWRFGRVRDAIVPSIMKDRTPQTAYQASRPRIIFFCGRSVEPWAPPSINTTGIGGSETAVIEIARRFARDGWRVDVYNDCDHYEGVYGDVGYWDCKRLGSGEKSDVLVSWRNPWAFDLPIERRMSLLWMHDLNKGSGAGEAMARWQKVLGVSAWHADYLSNVYRLGNTGYVPNGIDRGRYAGEVKKVFGRCVWASSPDRGLETLLQLWPQIVAQEPEAELHIAYGWETIEKSIAAGYDPYGQLRSLKAYIEGLIQTTPRVVWRGRLKQDELATLYQESYAWLYPTSFTETFCISAVEAMAGGCVPVTSAAGALPETIGDGGVVVTGNTYSAPWREFWVACAKAVLLHPDTRLPLVQKGMERAQGMTWDASFENHWKPLVTGLLEGTKERELATV